MKKEDVWRFIKAQNLAVVSTIDENGRPQAAVVEFGELDDLKIIIDTLKTSRKYKNLQINHNVAVVIGWDNNITVQIEGVAEELSGKELDNAKKAYFIKNPSAKKWANKPGITYFAIKPSWLRYSDVGKKPWFIKEFLF